MDAGCFVLNCPKEARWQIGFRVWPAGVISRTRRNGVEGITGFCVCDEHAIRDADQFYTAKRKQQIASAMLQSGRGLPDFSTAQVVHTEIGGGEAIGMAEAQRLGGLADLGA